ncbi:MAG TPA: VTT domain-containing protein [Cyclobacteriaceae bacterium]|nr:VTT domain-containing protein [Cyclobacteriaceae bacterium]
MELSLLDLFQPEALIKFGGLTLLLLIVFAETGLFFGFFLPGDSLLFVAGLLSNSPHINLPVWLLIALVVIAAVSGTAVGYGFGYWAKDYLYRRKENFFYKKKYLDITREVYQRHGMLTFVVGRFLPIVRTFIPILAGISKINFRKFMIYNFIGAAIWVITMIMSGHLFGKAFPNLINYLEIIIGAMILVTAVPVVITWINHRKRLATDEK